MAHDFHTLNLLPQCFSNQVMVYAPLFIKDKFASRVIDNKLDDPDYAPDFGHPALKHNYDLRPRGHIGSHRYTSKPSSMEELVPD